MGGGKNSFKAHGIDGAGVEGVGHQESTEDRREQVPRLAVLVRLVAVWRLCQQDRLVFLRICTERTILDRPQGTPRNPSASVCHFAFSSRFPV